MIMYQDQVQLLPGKKLIQKSIKIIHHTNDLKKKNGLPAKMEA